MRALVTATVTPEGLNQLGTRLAVETGGWGVTGKVWQEDELIAHLGEAEVLITQLEKISARVMASCPRLSIIGCCRGDPVVVDVAAATRLGIPVIHAPGRNAVSVAEWVLGAMIMLARHLPAAMDFLRRDQWGKVPQRPSVLFRGSELAQKVAGIIGLGAVGRELARRLTALDMEVWFHDPFVDQKRPPQPEIRPVGLDHLLQGADFVVVQCALTPQTRQLIGAKRIAMMKPSSFLINAARAAIVDEKALARALTEGRIQGAAVDVFGQEPVTEENPLLAAPNLIATPHVGGATRDVIRRHSLMVAEDVLRAIDGQSPQRLANPEVWREGFALRFNSSSSNNLHNLGEMD